MVGSNKEFPTPAPSDYGYGLVKGAIGGVPFVGPVVTEAIQLAIVSPLERRQQRWMRELANTVDELVVKYEDVTPETLGENEEFITVVASVSESALKTHNAEKLQLLKDVVFNAGSGLILEEFIRTQFLDLISRYTPTHVAILRALHDDKTRADTFDRAEQVNAETIKVPESGEDRAPYSKIEDLIAHLIPTLNHSVSEQTFVDLKIDRLCHASEGFAYTLSRGNNPLTTRGLAFLEFLTKVDE